jgi:hypothetical protein
LFYLIFNLIIFSTHPQISFPLPESKLFAIKRERKSFRYIISLPQQQYEAVAVCSKWIKASMRLLKLNSLPGGISATS